MEAIKPGKDMIRADEGKISRPVFLMSPHTFFSSYF